MPFPPTPETTLVILLGASEWPRFPALEASSAFSNAARDVIQYFRDPQGFRLPQGNLLNLFDSNESNDIVDERMNQFLDEHIRASKEKNASVARDILVYFIGHGYIAEGDSNFHLAIRRTRQNNPDVSSLSIKGLAKTLKEQARFQRRVIILDCCFAATAVKFYQIAGPIDIMRMQTNGAFEEKIVGKGFPGRGTTFVCSSSRKVRSRFLPDENSTMFTQAWLHALHTGSPYQEEKTLSLRVIHRLAVDFLLEKYGNEVPRPEVHSPDQSEGDVADVPLFPNRRTEQTQQQQVAARIHKVKEEGQSQSIKKQQHTGIEQAEQLLLSGQERMAGNRAGIILAMHLKKLCDRHSLVYYDKDGMRTLLLRLYNAEAITPSERKRLTRLVMIRDTCAHASSVSKDEVSFFIREVKKFGDWITRQEKPTNRISIPSQIVVEDLANLLQSTPNEIIRGLIKHSVFAQIKEAVDYNKAALVARDLGFEPSQYEANTVVVPPVVTIMGHANHGKTTLLDTIHKTKVAAGEVGGIPQRIGAYQIEINNQKITFLDTPGHEAFTAMRARGAQAADIAIIMVAADDGVMPQTREAIDHAHAAQMPIIIALNKIDKADANPDRVKQQLAEIGVIVEEYGGDVVCVPISAIRGTGIDELLEMILQVAEVQDSKANFNPLATGVIIEARLEKDSYATATVLVRQGTLKLVDDIVVGAMAGRVRAMINDRGKRVMKAPPSTPVSILGLPEVPQIGDRLEVVADEKAAKLIALQRKNESTPIGTVSLDTLYMQMQEGKVKELTIILKCDAQGSAESLKNALNKVGEENLKIRLIREGIGNISETDVHLAAASGAIIIGFNVKADGAAHRMAEKEGVDIRYYNFIYKMIDDIQAALIGMLEPTFQEVIEEHATVEQIFKAGKSTVIVGCHVTDGKVTRSTRARIFRQKTKVYEGQITSLRRGKDDVPEVATGYECGIILENFIEFKIGDVIETFKSMAGTP